MDKIEYYTPTDNIIRKYQLFDYEKDYSFGFRSGKTQYEEWKYPIVGNDLITASSFLSIK